MLNGPFGGHFRVCPQYLPGGRPPDPRWLPLLLRLLAAGPLPPLPLLLLWCSPPALFRR